MEMEVRDMMSNDKKIDMFCSLAGFERPAQTCHEEAKSLCFLIGLLC
jgi:hypothetical protein